MSQRDKSTNVRSLTLIQRLGKLLPRLTSWAATRLFFTPPRPRRTRARERAVMERGVPLSLKVRGEHVRAWRFGSGPRVLVQHGWGGSSSQMSSIIEALVAAGFGVVALDAPGHGESRWRAQTSLLEFADAMKELVASEGPIVAAVGHSLGAASVAFAQARGLGAQALVLVAPFAKPRRAYEGFLRGLGVGTSEVARARAAIEARVGIDFDELDLRDNLAKAAVPTWIVHDHEDRRVAFEGSREVAASLDSVHLMPTRGLGHGRLLRDQRVVSSIVNALGQGELPRPWTTIRAPLPEAQWALSADELRADLEYGRA